MATRKINYKDKSPLQTKPEIPEENKVNAEDLNQIKEVVNNNADEIELRQLKEEGKGLSKNDFTDELKAKLESLNNYNDTEIKKEINEINKKVAENTENDIKQDTEIETLKTNYTNLQEQNTKLEEKIKKDRENMINLEIEGQSIHIEDSSDLEGKLEVLGNVEQDVREGYNLFNVKNISNKFITDNGVEQANEDWVLSDFIEVEEFTDYLLGWTSTSPVFQARIILYNKDKSFMQVLNFFYENMYKKTFRTIQNCKYVRISYSTSVRGQEVKRKNVQLVKGTTEKPYEQYGASPTPEYPSEIRAVGDNINLLENTAKTQTVNGVTFTVNEDGTVIANGTATSLAQISLVANLKLSAGTYTIKDAKAYVESEDFNDWFDGLATASTLTFNTEVLLKNVYIQVKQGETVNNKIFYPKLEKSTVATSWSKFGQGSVKIKKQNKNLFDILKYPFTNKVAYAPNGQLNYWTGYYGITEYFPVEENSNYVFSNDLNKPITYGLMFYNKNKEFISGIVENTTKFITPKNCKYIRFSIQSDTIPNKVQIEHGDKATEIVEHQEETKILPIQKPMLEGDYFIKEADGWKEVHKLEKKIFNGTERFGNIESTGSVKYFSCYEVLNTYKYLGDNTANYISNCFKNIPVSQRYRNNTFFINSGKNPIFSSNSFSTTEEFKAKLVELYNANNPMYIYYELATPTKLPCTPEQTEILDELDNFQTYKPVTNITTDSIAKLKLKYIADTKTYIDNKTSNLEQQVNTINQLLSTTKTSSVLLDNLQTDIEREVL